MKAFADRYYNENVAVQLIYMDRSIQLQNGSYSIVVSLKSDIAVTLSLPRATENANNIITVRAEDLGNYDGATGSIVVRTNGRDAIDMTVTMSTPHDWVLFYCSGDRWWDIAYLVT